MPRIQEMMKKGKFLKKEDLEEIGGEAQVTIVGVKEMNVAMENQPENLKWVMKVRELDQLVVLNNTNLQLMEKATGSDDSAEWKGKHVILYVDESVSFGGKLVGGVRIRGLPKAIERPAKPAAAEPEVAEEVAGKPVRNKAFDDFEDDIPFERGN